MSIFGTVWTRFTANWQRYASIGLGTVVSAVVMYVVAFALMLILGGAQIMRLLATSSLGVTPDPQMIGRMIIGFFGSMLIVWLISFFFMAFIYSGMTGSVVALRAGEPVGFGTFFQRGFRYMWRMAGLLFLGFVLMMLIMFGVELVFGIAFVIAGIISTAAQSTAGFFLLIPVGILLLPFMIGLQIYLLFYTGYLMINDQIDVFSALGKALSAFFKGLGEAYLSALIMLGLALVVLVPVVLISVVLALVAPALGALAYILFFLLIGIFAGPLLTDYLAERFEQRVRPKLAQ